MKKWLLLILLLFIIVIWQAFVIYGDTMSELKKGEQRAVTYAQENSDVVSIDDVEYYHGNQVYYIIYGKGKDNEAMIVWVPEQEDGKMLVMNASEGWSREKVQSHVIDSQNPAEIIDIRLGAEVMKDNRTDKTETTPLWEVTYIDQQDRHTYYFIKFIDGSFVKRYSLKKERF